MKKREGDGLAGSQAEPRKEDPARPSCTMTESEQSSQTRDVLSSFCIAHDFWGQTSPVGKMEVIMHFRP